MKSEASSLEEFPSSVVHFVRLVGGCGVGSKGVTLAYCVPGKGCDYNIERPFFGL